jgi:4-amino-4-deoxy-L-arabinose transferase-like glycosyltransferase
MIAGIREWWRREDEPVALAVAAVVAVGAIARLSALSQPMRYDESVTYLYFIGRSWSTALTGYQFPNNHQLYTLVAKLTSMLGGGAPWALRLPAFVAGVAILPLTYAVGTALFTRTSALFGTAFAAAATPLILYSANARGYAFVIAGYLMLLLIGERILRDGPTARRWAAYALTVGAGLATIPTMLFPAGAAALWLALTVIVARDPRRRAVLLGLAAALAGGAAIAAVAYLPIVSANGIGALVANKFVTASPWPQFYAQLLPSLESAVATWAQPYPLVLAVLLCGGVAVGVAQSTRVSKEGVSVLLAAYVWSAAVLLVEHRVPFARTWLWMLPVVALATGTACERVLRWPRLARLGPYVPGLAAAIAAGGVAWGFASNALGRSTDTGVFAGARTIAGTLATQTQAGDRILAPIPSNAPLQYYLLRAGGDTSLLSTPDSLTTREIVVLNAAYGQTVPWAIAVGMVDTSRFGPIAPATHAGDANVYVAERRRAQP